MGGTRPSDDREKGTGTMTRTSKTAELADLTTLAKGVVNDCERLVTDHIALARAELREQWDEAKASAVHLGLGAGLVAAGGFFGIVAAAHYLHRSTRLPLWSCYGLTAGALAAAGMPLVKTGLREGARLGFPSLPQTVQTLKEDARWLKESVQAPTPSQP